MCCNPYCRCIDQDGCSALLLATEQGHHECLSTLLEHGAVVDKAARVSAVRHSRYKWYLLFVPGYARLSHHCL